MQKQIIQNVLVLPSFSWFSYLSPNVLLSIVGTSYYYISMSKRVTGKGTGKERRSTAQEMKFSIKDFFIFCAVVRKFNLI